VGVATVAAIIATLGAYAYFTNSGSGTGSASVGSSSAIAITGSTAGALHPAPPGPSASRFTTRARECSR
jgi:hypothetical protein